MKTNFLAALAAVMVFAAGCGRSKAEIAKKSAADDTASAGDISSPDDDTIADISSAAEAPEGETSQAEISPLEEYLSSSEADASPSEPEQKQEVIIPEDYDPGIVMSRWRYITPEGFSQVISNERLSECFDRLDEIAAQYGDKLAFSYQNADTGAKISYNSSRRFMTCSTIKAPYVKSILESGIEPSDRIVKDKIWQGDIYDTEGVCAAEDGTEFTAEELMRAAVQQSDNTAYYLLEQYYGWQVFNDLQYRIGANYYVGEDWIFTSATTEDMLRSYMDIYRYSVSDQRGKWLTDLMTNTDHNMQIGRYLSEKYKVSQKYGSEFNENVYNDCAIVYANLPFVLCIFSNQRPETEESAKVFTDLAEIFDEINSLIYTD